MEYIKNIKETLITLIIGDYILDEMTKRNKIEMFPNPYRWIRNKLIENCNVPVKSKSKNK